jgi:hypothetical protein
MLIVVVVVVVIIVITVMEDHNLVVIIVTITVMNHDDFSMMVPIPVFVLVADVDGDAAFLRNHHRPVACCRPGQRRSAQDRKRARDKSKFVHVIFLHWGDVAVRRRQTGCRPVARYATRKAPTAVVSSFAFEK